MNRKKRCINCGCKFYPHKHIAVQKYCSKKWCQDTRKANWRKNKLKHDKKYRFNKKEAQNKWKINNPDYWKKYRANILGEKLDVIKIRNPVLKISLPKNILANLHKFGSTKGNYRVVFTFT